MSKTCSICFDNKKTSEFLIFSCRHLACIDCVSQWITLKIADKHYTIDSKTACFMGKCRKEIPLQEIYQKLPLLPQQKMDEALLQVYFSRQRDIRKCPNSGCSYAGTINMQKSCTFPLQCDVCGTEWREKEHYTTFQKICGYLKTLSNTNTEELSEDCIKQKSKECPSCKVLIEKNGGCDHMTCKYCKHEFCWICLEKYPAHNQRIHSNRIFIPFIKVFLILMALFLALSSVFGIMTTLNLYVNVITWVMTWTFYIINILLIWLGNCISLLDELLKSHDENGLVLLIRFIFALLDAISSA